MFLSVFEIFKIGIGPSSSHTVGPMVAAARFLAELSQSDLFVKTSRVMVRFYGSLAFTGKGHASDKAAILGFLGAEPATIDPLEITPMLAKVANEKRLALGGRSDCLIDFHPDDDVVMDYGPNLPHHANGMRFYAWQGETLLLACEYYSVGGGFVMSLAEILASQQAKDEPEMAQGSVMAEKEAGVPFPFATAKEMLAQGKLHGLSIAAMKRRNELVRQNEAELEAGLDRLIRVMESCIERGMGEGGLLPGDLKVKRRAKALAERLLHDGKRNDALPHDIMDHISLYALAVNEENAAGGQVVTAPTNGAAGIIPAVLYYYRKFCTGTLPDEEAKRRASHDFLLTAAAIGGLIKHNASISGAEVGCQGEVGSASAMAAAALAAVLGGTNEQIENAAEIALEHHLGMTCDPIGGLVQIPCIERNAFGAVKAVNAASLALKGDGTHFVSLDAAIITMRETGKDMLGKYKETSLGGLAVNAVSC